MDQDVLEQARARLAQIAGVAGVVIDTTSGEIALICLQPIQRHHIEDEARVILDSIEGGPKDYTIEVTYRAEHRERARVRFGEVRRQTVGSNVRVEVDLEWGADVFSGTATGELGHAQELRTSAQATLSAISTIVGDLDLKLAGVKQVKSFDAEMIVVSLYAAEDPSRKFVGAVVAGPEPLRSAVVAVLSALNRLLGNYLNRP